MTPFVRRHQACPHEAVGVHAGPPEVRYLLLGQTAPHPALEADLVWGQEHSSPPLTPLLPLSGEPSFPVSLSSVVSVVCVHTHAHTVPGHLRWARSVLSVRFPLGP